MSDRLGDAVYSAIANTLENMTFLEVGKDLADARRYPEEEILSCRLLIHDPLQGEMYLLMPRPLLQKIASTVYILPEQDLSEKMVLDMLGELINTIGGLLMTAYLPQNQTYALGLPENGVGLPEADFSSMKEWEFQVDDIVFSLTLVGDGFFQE
ncbi:MAG: chemotaxis protein CheX [Syntrophotaleaceae bacterium]